MAERPSTLVFDGDCGICRYWVNYWHSLTRDRVAYRAYQEAAPDFPTIPREAFARAVQLIEPDGSAYAGAAATYRVLHDVPGHSAWWWLYNNMPGFAAASEQAYTFLSRRRGLLNAISRFLWGPALEAERYSLVTWVFLRLLGAVYIAAFASLAVQVRGLAGDNGILPLKPYLDAAHTALGGTAYAILPTLFWLNASDAALTAGAVVGALLGLLVMLDRRDRYSRPALVGLFVLYLSYVYAGQEFMSFQWDLLLLETGFLAIFLATRSRIVVWLYRWLLFRYLFLAGAVKLVSGDHTWRELTALEYHFWTQPLPTPLAWYAAHLPSWMLVAGTATTLIVEVGVVFLIFLPRRVRAAAASSVLFFQLAIVLTGNYNFFNLLTMLLCVFLFDDAALRCTLPRRLASWVEQGSRPPTRTGTTIAAMLALIVVPVGVNRIAQTLMRVDLPVASTVSVALSPLLVVNPYGLFAVMTTTRPEIVIEGSYDGKAWQEYVFKYKPGPVSRPPLWNIPHQPRLDWQMWFAALGEARDNPWLISLLQRLLEGSPSVLALLESNPFADRPPTYVRAALYEYRFADPATHAQTGQWWVRSFAGWYLPQRGASGFSSEVNTQPESADKPSGGH